MLKQRVLDIFSKEIRTDILNNVKNGDISLFNLYLQSKYGNMDQFIKFTQTNAPTCKYTKLEIVGLDFFFTVQTNNFKTGKKVAVEVLCDLLKKFGDPDCLEFIRNDSRIDNRVELSRKVDEHIVRINSMTKNDDEKIKPFFYHKECHGDSDDSDFNSNENDESDKPYNTDKKPINNEIKTQIALPLTPDELTTTKNCYSMERIKKNLSKRGLHIIKCENELKTQLWDIILNDFNANICKEQKDFVKFITSNKPLCIMGYKSWLNLDSITGRHVFMVFEDSYPSTHAMRRCLTFNGVNIK